MRDVSSQAAWPGLDLFTADLDVNPLLASYTGAPHQIRGTDPAGYGQSALAWWESLGEQPVDSSPAPAAQNVGLPGWLSWVPGVDKAEEGAKAFGLGAAGVLLALLVVGFGLLVLWKS